MTLSITLIQTDIIWENISKNLEIYSDKIKNIKTDVIVLPEMFTTGFTMKPQNSAEDMFGETITWMKSNSSRLDCAICGSIIIKEDNKYFNRFIWVNPDGTLFHYDKKHLFSFAGENEHYSSGDSKLIIEYKGYKICPLICYDLRFPVWSRNVENYDLLLYVANWPSIRKKAWKSLLIARAIENQCYAIAANQGGFHLNGRETFGHTMIVDPWGKVISRLPNGSGVVTAEVSAERIRSVRKAFPALDHVKLINA